MDFLALPAAVVVVAMMLAFGGFWGMVRDQDTPSWTMTEAQKRQAKAEGRYFRKWKETGIFVVGIPLALLTWYAYGWHEALVVYAGTAAAWSLPHDLSDVFRRPERGSAFGLDMLPGGDGQIHAVEAWANMAVSGLAVTLATAGVMAWNGDVVLAIVAALLGLSKPLFYRLAYELVGVPPQPHDQSKPIWWYSFWGHTTFSAIAMGGAALCLVLA